MSLTQLLLSWVKQTMCLVAGYVAFLSPRVQELRRRNNCLPSLPGSDHKSFTFWAIIYALEVSIYNHLSSSGCVIINVTLSVQLGSIPNTRENKLEKKNGLTDYLKGKWILIRMFLPMTSLTSVIAFQLTLLCSFFHLTGGNGKNEQSWESCVSQTWG